MSSLPISQSSTNRPTAGSEGSVFFEPSSNKIIVKKADGSFKEISTDASLQGSVPAGVLNYPGGLYADLTGTYVLERAPALHFSSFDPAGTLRGISYSQGGMVTTWGDCSGNGNHAIAQDLLNSPTLSNVNGYACVQSSTVAGAHYEPIKGHPIIRTVFMVQSGSPHVTPFGDYNWGRGSLVNSVYTNYLFNKNLPAKGVDVSLASIRCGQLNAGGNHSLTSIPVHVWNSDGGASHASTATMVTVDRSAITFLHTYSMHNFEFLFFEEILTLTEMNTVFDYLKNKYDGLGHISSSSASPLTLS